MSAFVNYAGARVTSGRITIPMYGLWSADLSFADSTSLPDTGALTVGDLTLTGYVHRTADYAGHRAARLAAGFGGWRRQVSAQAYHLPTGVPLALVLTDVAGKVGEHVDVSDVGLLGGYYFREADVAQRVLRRLAGPMWYLDTDGTTRIRERASDAITSAFLVTAYDPAAGRATIATEHLSDWMPGRTFSAPQFDGSRRIQSTSVTVQNDGTLRLECLVRDASIGVDEQSDEPTPDDRLMAAIRQIIRSELPSGVGNDGSALILDGGTGTSEHVATVEGVVNLIWQTFIALGAQVSGNWNGTNIPAAITTALEQAITQCSVTTVIAFQPTIEASLAIKRATLESPGVGCAEVFSG